jgi:hypothetical protein
VSSRQRRDEFSAQATTIFSRLPIEQRSHERREETFFESRAETRAVASTTRRSSPPGCDDPSSNVFINASENFPAQLAQRRVRSHQRLRKFSALAATIFSRSSEFLISASNNLPRGSRRHA